MGSRSTVVVDTNVLLNLATPVVDGRSIAPTGADPFAAMLTTYEVHVPTSVLGEVSDALGGGDLLSAAADTVMKAADRLTTHDVATAADHPLDFGLDPGESHGVWLANEIQADMFVTDEFNQSNLLLISLGLDDRNILFTTPHVLCTLSSHGILDTDYVDALLSYYIDTKHWDRTYVNRLRNRYLKP